MRMSFAVVVFSVVLVALGYFGWRTLVTHERSLCAACSRPLHRESAVWAEVDGDRQHFCCAACALWVERQTGARVEITEVSDHASGASIDPAEAVFVVGSNVNHCLRQQSVFDPQRAALDEAKGAGSLEFDRCSPSILAFSNRTAAAQFADQNGGQVSTMGQLRAAIP